VTPAAGVQITQGEDKITTVGTTVTRSFCSQCGCIVNQGPVGGSFRAVSPVTFHLPGKLPEELLPKVHLNYENRHLDWNDDLPKFKMFGNSPRMDNQGNIIEDKEV